MSSTPEATTVEVVVERWVNGRTERASDEVAQETPIALVYHGVPHVVMLATPADLEDYAVGFTVSEGLVNRPDEIQSVEVVQMSDAMEVRVGIAAESFSRLLQRRRNLTGRTGCGLCGTESLEQAMRPINEVKQPFRIGVDELHAAFERLGELQSINARTGSVHAAAWVVPGAGIKLVREDVGRHNALDKALGALIRSKADIAAGCMLITSRASYEMVQKSATAGVGLLAAVSAPTGLAIRVAEQSGLTLVGFARRDRHVVYTHPERLTGGA